MKVHCAGPLEVSGTVITLHVQRCPKANGKVQFLHRIVKGYLKKRDVWNTVLSMTTGTDFSSEISLLRSYLLQLKILPPKGEISHISFAYQSLGSCERHNAKCRRGQPQLEPLPSGIGLLPIINRTNH